MEELRYITIFEDGSIQAWVQIPEEIFVAFEDGLYDIIDMKAKRIYVGNGEWDDLVLATY